MLKWYKIFLLMQLDEIEKKYTKKLEQIEKNLLKNKNWPFKYEQQD